MRVCCCALHLSFLLCPVFMHINTSIWALHKLTLGIRNDTEPQARPRKVHSNTERRRTKKNSFFTSFHRRHHIRIYVIPNFVAHSKLNLILLPAITIGQNNNNNCMRRGASKCQHHYHNLLKSSHLSFLSVCHPFGFGVLYRSCVRTPAAQLNLYVHSW